MNEIIKTILADFYERGIPKFIERDNNLPVNSGKIITLTGPRRAGKTYLMFQVMKRINELKDVIYINFEDERIKWHSDDFDKIIQVYHELNPQKENLENIYFFFDEIQEIDGWQKFIRRIYDTISKNIFITGSSAKLLSREIATNLRGRSINFDILPLSFNEYLRFRSVRVDKNTTAGKSKIASEFKSFLINGGFPETVGMDDNIRLKTLQSYLDVMLYRDLIERFEIVNPTALKYLTNKLLSNTARIYSVNKIYNELKSQGVKIARETLSNFTEYLEDTFIVFSVAAFTESFGSTSQKKAYSVDNGLSNSRTFTLSDDTGRLLENCVFHQLKRSDFEFYYFRGKYECDFVVKEKNKIVECIQVCAHLNENNIKREYRGLKEAMKRFDLNKGKIITMEQNYEEEKIKVIPVTEWLLN